MFDRLQKMRTVFFIQGEAARYAIQHHDGVPDPHVLRAETGSKRIMQRSVPGQHARFEGSERQRLVAGSPRVHSSEPFPSEGKSWDVAKGFFVV